MVDKQPEETINDQIIALLGKGYTRVQLIKDFKFAERTVDSAIKEYKEQHGDVADETNKGDVIKNETKKRRDLPQGDNTWNDGLPVMRKVGSGVEVINPQRRCSGATPMATTSPSLSSGA